MEKDLTIRIDADDLLFRATVENVNEETRTFDVVFATETPVPKMDWNRYVMVDEILERVFDEINIKFSVKCRLGYSSADEIDDLINVFNNYPLRELIVHPRIGKQLYSGETDLNKFGFIVNKTNKLTVYNGDIFSLEHFLLLKQKFPQFTTNLVKH